MTGKPQKQRLHRDAPTHTSALCPRPAPFSTLVSSATRPLHVRPRIQLTSPVPLGRASRLLGPVCACVEFSRREKQLAVTLIATHRHGQTEHTTGHASPPHYDPHDARRMTHTLCRDRMRRRVKKRYVVSHGYDMVFLPVNPLFTLPLRDQIASSLQCTSIVDFVRFTCTFNANWWLWFKSWLPKPRVGMPCDPVHTLNVNHSIKV